MELELETKVEENQISFDFLQPQTITKGESFDWVAKSTLVVLLKTKFCDFDLCGKSCLQWVSMATSVCKQKVISAPSEEDLLAVIKNIVLSCEEQYEFVTVLYSDTPCLKKSTFFDVMEYFSKQHMNVLRLSRGFVFRTEYLKNALVLMSSFTENFDQTDFMVVDSAAKLNLAHKILSGRILEYHKQNGVIFLGESAIDADVEIEAGVVIYGGNSILGESFVAAGAVIESGNYIKDSIICENVHVVQSHIVQSKICKDVGPFEKIVGQQV